MFTLLLVLDHAGHNISGLRLLSGASAELWMFEEKGAPHWDRLNTPD
jgi:hypothetical protein